LGFVVGAATLFGFLSRLGWPIELAAHLRVQYFLILASLALLSLAAKRRVAAALFSAFALVNGAVVLPSFPGVAAVAQAGEASLRLMLVNVRGSNRDHSGVLAAVRDASPDVVLFEEVNPRWFTHLSSLSADYAFSVSDTREDNFGIALFSRLPLIEPRVESIGSADVPSIVTGLHFDGEVIRLVGTHPVPPVSRAYAQQRDEQLLRIGDLLSSLEPPYILLGDLNTSPWSHTFERLLDAGELLDTARGRGLQPTWPAVFWPLLMPIDHCLVSRDLRVLGRRVGPFVGSDHYPLIVDLALEPSLRSTRTSSSKRRFFEPA
jgi:endonuclease/exonuclease/phosphatase (EEP) superfamily protein YafD